MSGADLTKLYSTAPFCPFDEARGGAGTPVTEGDRSALSAVALASGRPCDGRAQGPGAAFRLPIL